MPSVDLAEHRVAPSRGQRIELAVIREIHIELRIRAVGGPERAMPRCRACSAARLPDSLNTES